MPITQALQAPTTERFDFLDAYISGLEEVLD